MIAATNAVLAQQVVVLTFDEQGVLGPSAARRRTNSVPVAVVARTTPSPGNDASFLQQLLGNVGKFSPAGTGGGGGFSGHPAGRANTEEAPPAQGS